MIEENPSLFLRPDFLSRLERLRLVAKRLAWLENKGEHPSARKGFSLEFSDYRRYQKGDDLRYVDWNIYRRLEKLFLKLFTAEGEMNIYLLLDASRSMAEGDPPKIDYARWVAAALGYIGLRNLDRVGGTAFSASLSSPLALGKGRGQILALFSFLQRLACHGETDLAGSAQAFSRLFPRPGLVVLLSDLFDPEGWRAGLETLVRKGYQLVVVHIVDESELHPQGRGELSLKDVEGQGERRLFLDDEALGRFERELEAYFEEIRSFCLSRGIDYLRTTPASPFEDFVLSTLRQVRSVR